MSEEISEQINKLVNNIINGVNAEVQKALFESLEKVGICVFIEQHDLGLTKVLVVKNMKSSPILTHKTVIGVKITGESNGTFKE